MQCHPGLPCKREAVLRLRQEGQFVVSIIRRAVVVLLALALVPAITWASETASGDDRPALLIIDIQEFYFSGGAIPLEGSVEAADAARQVLARFRASGWPVIHVQHLPEGTEEPGQDVQPDAYRIRPAVAPAAGEAIVGKHHANAFRDTDLLDRLRSLKTDRLVIVGMQTHMCLEAATRAAADLGFDVTVVGDACATRDLEYGGETVPALEVHASTLASLDGSYARVISLDDFLKSTVAEE